MLRSTRLADGLHFHGFLVRDQEKAWRNQTPRDVRTKLVCRETEVTRDEGATRRLANDRFLPFLFDSGRVARGDSEVFIFFMTLSSVHGGRRWSVGVLERFPSMTRDRGSFKAGATCFRAAGAAGLNPVVS